ncbi:MAG: hypothetical protein ACN6PV_03290 [Achromobacter sp.]|uniref:hypothetical protein n=1 Tax=Achromobacter sp. TaxID=134375 RepID=UPI003CFE36DA
MTTLTASAPAPAPTLRGSGKISGVFFNAAGDVAAVASAFPLLAHPRARAAYGGRALRYRVALYRRDSLTPFAAFDDLHFPVNDVAFHPTGSIVAIGAGSYDGGYLFEGDLVVWNWREAHGVRLYEHVPEVVRCQYNAAGDAIEAWVRPWDEEWSPPDDGAGSDGADNDNDPFDTLFSLRAPAPGPRSQPLDLDLDVAHRVPADLSAPALLVPHSDELDASLRAWFNVSDWTRQDAILDVAWLDRDRYAAVHEGCQLEVYHRDGKRLAAYTGAGYGVEILQSKDVLVHVVETSARGRPFGRQGARLYTWTDCGSDSDNDKSLRLTRAYDGDFTFSATRQGQVLGRQNRFPVAGAGARAHDVLLDLTTGADHRPDLGHYDCFNHYIRIRHAPCLFLLQGTPASSHERKTLCVVQPDGAVRRLWPILKANRDPASHAMELCGAYVDDALGAAIIISGKHYSPDVRAPYSGFIYRKPLDRDRERWRRPIPASASAIVHLPGVNLIAAAFLDGSLQLIDAQSGALRRHARVHVDGLPTVIFAMDANEQSLVTGTVDGRISVLDIGELCRGQNVDAFSNTDTDTDTDSATNTRGTPSVINLD